MTRARPQVLSLNGGEVDREVIARSDIESYANKAQVYENAFPAVKGGMYRAPGTRFIGFLPAQVEGGHDDGRLFAWRFSRAQAFQVEMAPHLIRFVYGTGYVQQGDEQVTFAANWVNGSTGGATVTETAPTWEPPPSGGGGEVGGGSGGSGGGGGGDGGGGGGGFWWRDFDTVFD